MFAAHHEKIFVSAFFKISIDRLFDNRESGKIIVWKKSWILDPKICTSPVALLILKNCFKEQIYGPEYYVY